MHQQSILQRHLQTHHPENEDRNLNYFKRLGKSAKIQQLDNTGKQYQHFVGMVIASYEIALIVAKNKKPHTKEVLCEASCLQLKC